MRLANRVERLEQAMPSDDGQYQDRADYREHETYVVGKDGSCMDIPALDEWPDEAGLWASRPAGTKFLRIGGEETAEVIDGVARPVRFKPLVLAPDARRAMDELHRDITGEWPDQTREATL